jgi:hypothetical protein
MQNYVVSAVVPVVSLVTSGSSPAMTVRASALDDCQVSVDQMLTIIDFSLFSALIV